MNCTQARDYIRNLNRFGMRLGLERVERMLSLMGNPERGFRSILVGGTSGKGSTCAMLGSVLKEAGYKVGLFTKPHLFDFRERISVNGGMISEGDLLRLVKRLKPLAERAGKGSETPTFFEFLTALAFEYFREKKIDIAVLEVGLGGRLDATNVVDAEVSVITNVSLEHTDVLGKTVEKVTREKAGIVKKGGTLVTGSDSPKVLRILREACKGRKAKFLRASKLEGTESSPKGNSFEFQGSRINVPLAGRYQLRNIGCVLTVLDSLGEKIPPGAVKKGLENVKWPGRFELMEGKPLVLLDGAKDVEALKRVGESLDLLDYERLYTVLGVSRGKKIPEMVREISRKTDFFLVTRHDVAGRAAGLETLIREADRNGRPFLVIENVKEAVEKAKSLAGENDLILVTGSLFTVAEARELWFRKNPRFGRELNESLKELSTR